MIWIIYFQNDKTGAPQNPYRELDLAEISRWGLRPAVMLTLKTAEGNAQFAVQEWDNFVNLKRYSINEGVKEITVMGNGQMQIPLLHFHNMTESLRSIIFGKAEQYLYDNSFTNPFIPADGCQLFHMNLWMEHGQGENIPDQVIISLRKSL
ncbi:MAG: hypothetical protein R2942_03625 [Ignavibacteria bacterium]